MRDGGLVFLGGLGAGAGLMFLLDPRSGRRRRAHVRDELRHDARSVAAGAGKTVRDVAHRSRGLVARVRAAVRRRSAPDQVIEGRVRALLGRICSHPGAIDVVSDNGRIQLAGAILESEHHGVVSAVSGIRGVRGISDMLHPHPSAEQVPDLQGGVPRMGTRWDIQQRTWAPATSLLAGLVATGLVVGGTRSHRPAGWAAAGLGGLLMARALVNRPLGDIVGVGRRRHGLQIQKAIHVDAPVEEVFAFWSNLESFPRFMTHVRHVRQTGDRRYHWKVGPFEWEAEVTRLEPNKQLAWRSLPGAVVRNRGVVRFRHDGHLGTEVSVRLSYRPPAGMLGHSVARLLGADPKRQMDDDLLRFKSLVEQGSATGRGRRILREDIARG
jgi:uncharacterized membrane protein